MHEIERKIGKTVIKVYKIKKNFGIKTAQITEQ
jgi:hypothetical protein